MKVSKVTACRFTEHLLLTRYYLNARLAVSVNVILALKYTSIVHTYLICTVLSHLQEVFVLRQQNKPPNPPPLVPLLI